MAGRISYYGGIVRDGLVFHVDAARRESYEKGTLIWKDLTDNSNNGTLTNGASFNEESSNSISFDGNNDYVEFGSINSSNPLSLVGTSEQTFEVWFKSDGTGDPFQRLIDKSNAGGGAGGYFLSLNQPGDGAIFVKINNNVTDTPAEDSIGYLDNVWNQVVCARKNNTTNGWNIYLNGVLKVSRNTTNLSVPTTTCNFRIGTWYSTTTREFKGEIGDVKIYNKALNASEVAQNYNALKGRFGL